ncbi:MAG: pyrimidine reductase [Pseudonocardiales bacterium]|nr:MAG: pyrimidine reductase [Pseudonocardiales bacterium]
MRATGARLADTSTRRRTPTSVPHEQARWRRSLVARVRSNPVGPAASNRWHRRQSEGPLVRTLIVTEFMTLDGVVEAPGGEPTHPHTGWTIPFGVPGLYAYKLQETLDAESLLLGRITYQGFSSAWPDRDGEFADKMNAMPKHVVTGTLPELGWNATALIGDVPAAVMDLKRGDGGPILVAGSATLVRTLLAHGLVDEMRLMVFPIMIGGGLRIFPEDRGKITLELTQLERYDSGALLQVYRPVA